MGGPMDTAAQCRPKCRGALRVRAMGASMPKKTDIEKKTKKTAGPDSLELLGQRFQVVQESAPAGQAPSSEVGRLEIEGRCYAIRTAEAPPAPKEEALQFDVLTERELQIAVLVARGRLNKQIAHQLGISEYTVCTHIRHMFCKLRVRTRAEMVYRCAACLRDLAPAE
jgi:ATP/maltotriose-dependent transcriptional regulator MalT